MLEPPDREALLLDGKHPGCRRRRHASHPDLLALREHRTIEAENGDEALELMMQHRPDLVILDRMMPSFTGVEVSKRIREAPELTNTHIIMMTARTDSDPAD